MTRGARSAIACATVTSAAGRHVPDAPRRGDVAGDRIVAVGYTGR